MYYMKLKIRERETEREREREWRREREKERKRERERDGGREREQGKVGVSNDKVGGESCNIWWITVCHFYCVFTATLSLFDQNGEWLNVVLHQSK